MHLMVQRKYLERNEFLRLGAAACL